MHHDSHHKGDKADLGARRRRGQPGGETIPSAGPGHASQLVQTCPQQSRTHKRESTPFARDPMPGNGLRLEEPPAEPAARRQRGRRGSRQRRLRLRRQSCHPAAGPAHQPAGFGVIQATVVPRLMRNDARRCTVGSVAKRQKRCLTCCQWMGGGGGGGARGTKGVPGEMIMECQKPGIA